MLKLSLDMLLMLIVNPLGLWLWLLALIGLKFDAKERTSVNSKINRAIKGSRVREPIYLLTVIVKRIVYVLPGLSRTTYTDIIRKRVRKARTASALTAPPALCAEVVQLCGGKHI